MSTSHVPRAELLHSQQWPFVFTTIVCPPENTCCFHPHCCWPSCTLFFLEVDFELGLFFFLFKILRTALISPLAQYGVPHCLIPSFLSRSPLSPHSSGQGSSGHVVPHTQVPTPGQSHSPTLTTTDHSNRVAVAANICRGPGLSLHYT